MKEKTSIKKLSLNKIQLLLLEYMTYVVGFTAGIDVKDFIEPALHCLEKKTKKLMKIYNKLSI